MKSFTDMEYDEFLAFVEEARRRLGPVKYVVARSVEAAEAFSCWCVDNGIEEPEIIVL